jgi:hypothetical protein
MRGRVVRPQQAPETARVAQAQRVAVVEHHVHMIVRARRGVGRDDAQAARHAQMQEEIA